MVGATAAQSIYYFPKSDLAATAIASRAIDAGAARGYGALETMTATELMIDEIAGELGLDPIEFRLTQCAEIRHEEHPGRDPGRGTPRADEVLDKARAHTLWTGRAARKQAYDAAHPGKYYGVGFGCIQRRLWHRGGSQPREGRAVAGRAHHALITPARRSAPAHPRARRSPARAGWGGRPMPSIWPSPTGPTCRWRPAAIRMR